MRGRKPHSPEALVLALALTMTAYSVGGAYADEGRLLEGWLSRYGSGVVSRLIGVGGKAPPLPMAYQIAGLSVADIDRMDGTKFLFENGAWLLLRASGTEPVVRVYAEAPKLEMVEQLLRAGEALVRGR